MDATQIILIITATSIFNTLVLIFILRKEKEIGDKW
jgi:hypothetical protein